MTYPGLDKRRIVVGLSGSIAAYKGCNVISTLRQCGADVRVMTTENATEFVGPAALRGLSGHNVACDMFQEYTEGEIEHISLAEFAEVMVIVGATANVIARVAAGICDDLLTTVLCAAECPILFAPAMNWRMWENPATKRNVQKLKEYGYEFVGPVEGHLACEEAGFGRMAPVDGIVDVIDRILGPDDSALAGKSMLITAGPTRQEIDPVRYISNPSSGRMGFALAQEALARKASVTIVAGPTTARAPWNADIVRVKTTEEMLTAVREHHDGADIVIGAAAPVDFRPADRQEQKIDKGNGGGLTLRLVQTPDILANIADSKGGRVHVGFAAETEDIEDNAIAKLDAKQLDMIVANDVSAEDTGFAADHNEVTIYHTDGRSHHVSKTSKRKIAMAVCDEIEKVL